MRLGRAVHVCCELSGEIAFPAFCDLRQLGLIVAVHWYDDDLDINRCMRLLSVKMLVRLKIGYCTRFPTAAQVRRKLQASTFYWKHP